MAKKKGYGAAMISDAEPMNVSSPEVIDGKVEEVVAARHEIVDDEETQRITPVGQEDGGSDEWFHDPKDLANIEGPEIAQHEPEPEPEEPFAPAAEVPAGVNMELADEKPVEDFGRNLVETPPTEKALVIDLGPEKTELQEAQDALGIGGTIEIGAHEFRVKAANAGNPRYGHGKTIDEALYDLANPGQMMPTVGKPGTLGKDRS